MSSTMLLSWEGKGLGISFRVPYISRKQEGKKSGEDDEEEGNKGGNHGDFYYTEGV